MKFVVLPILILLVTLLTSCTSDKKQFSKLAQTAYNHIGFEEYQRAMDIGYRLVELDPTNSEAHYILGLSLNYLDDCKSAIKSLTRSIQLDSIHGKTYLFRADCYLKIGKPDSAYIDIMRSLEIDTARSYRRHAWDFLDENFSMDYQEEMSFKLNGIILNYSYNSWGYKHGSWKAYYPDSTLRAQGKYVNGKKEGVEQYFYENGQLERIGTYENGQPHGTFKDYHETGQIMFENNFENGVLDGPMRGWYESGQMEFEFYIKNGEDHGKHTVWLEDGRMKIQSHYENGVVNGEVMIWDEEEEKYFIEIYNQGQFIGKRVKE